MKNVMGGKLENSGWCSTTFTCANGTTQTMTCENAQAGCVGVDAGDSGGSGNGYGYCQQNGVVTFSTCAS